MERSQFSAALLLVALFASISCAQKSEKYALLVGVAQYEHAQMNSNPLKFPESDATAVAELLKSSGYTIDVLLAQKATQAAIRSALQKASKQGTQGGAVLIGLFGHGVQYGPTAYYCPFDAAIREVKDSQGNPLLKDDGQSMLEPDPETLVAMSDILKPFKLCGASNRILLADCCRDDPNRARGRNPFGTSLKVDDLPRGTAAFFACSANEKAFEHDDWQHGAFTYAFLKHAKRLADSGAVTSGLLKHYMFETVEEIVKEKTKGRERQTLYAISNGGRVDFKLSRKHSLVELDSYNQQSFSLVQKHAKAGFSKAQYKLALMYDEGEGVALDDAEAVRWYRKAANQNHVSAQYNLALMYRKGEGVSKNDVEAARWYRKAVAQNHLSAQYNLALMYDYGKGVALDDAEAARLYRKAAEQDHVKAQYNLALMYDNGEGVAVDDAEAVKWYRKAAEQDHVKAQYNLALLYDNGEGVALDDAEAVKWYRKAANQNHLSAQYNLALMYDFGEGVAVDDAEAVKWYRKAANQDHASAQYNLALKYRKGEGVSKNDVEAAKWYRKAAEQDHVKAQYNLAHMYDDGKGVALDDAEAVKWYLKAANQDHASAQYNLALMYDHGEGVAEDDAEAARWFRRAAQLGSESAVKALERRNLK